MESITINSHTSYLLTNSECSAVNMNVVFMVVLIDEIKDQSCFHWWDHAVAQFDESLRYKPEDRGFDSRPCH
jgi:hypothetical protein